MHAARATRPGCKQIRQQAAVVVALGACAHLGGVNALKALHPLEDVRQYVYGDKAELVRDLRRPPDRGGHPGGFRHPRLPDRPGRVPGLRQGAAAGQEAAHPGLPAVRGVQAARRTSACITRGKVCLGPVTRAGCKAICPTYGQSCEACRGFISNPNDSSMRNVLAEHGLTVEDITSMYTMFTTYQVRQKYDAGQSLKAGS